MPSIFYDDIGARIGWTLIHSIWQIALLGGLFWVSNRALVRWSAESRYMLGCSVLFLMLLGPFCWYVCCTQPTVDDLATPTASAKPVELEVPPITRMVQPVQALYSFGSLTGPPPTLAIDGETQADNAWTRMTFHWPHGIAMVWLVGVLLLSLRPILGFGHAWRLCRLGRSELPAAVQSIFSRVAEAMGVRKAVRISQSTLAQVPCVVGWFRPVILLPTSALTGLSTQQLESILAHELAHVRRHDFLVNLVQVTIETLLFFHPVMWWVSRCVRREREFCCDDLALQVCGNREAFSEALLAVGGVKAGSRLALASDGSVLFERVRRILKPQESLEGKPLMRLQRRPLRSTAATFVALLGIGAAAVRLRGNETETDLSTKESMMASESNEPKADAKSQSTKDDVQRWSNAMNDRDLNAIAALLAEDEKFATMEFVPREKLPFYHAATYKPTHYANMQDDRELMATLLKGGVAPSFGFAVESVEMAKLIIRYGGRLDTWDTLDYTPVITSCWFPNAELMQVLLEAGADPNYAKQNSGATGLMILAERADDNEAIEIAKLLIKYGADVNQKAFSGLEDQPVTWDAYTHDVSQGHETALHWAASYGKSGYAEFLIENGADANAKTISIHRGGKNADGSLKFEPYAGESPLDWAFKGGDEKTIRMFGGSDMLETVSGAARAGQSSASVVRESRRPAREVLSQKECPQGYPMDVWRLFCASANGDLATVKQIIQESPNFVNSFVWYETPLHYAVRENQIDVARELLAAGVNPAYSNFTYSSWPKLLVIADERGFDEIHALLVVQMQKRFNYQPGYETLWNAIEVGDIGEVKRLIASNPNCVNEADPHGNRPIHWAILSRNIPIIQLLLDNGADINAKRADMQSPLHLAVIGYDYWFNKKNHKATTSASEVAEFIRDNGAEYEFTAAVAYNDIEFVKRELAEDRGLANRLNEARRSPLSFAARRGHLEMVQLLLDHGADPNLPEHCADDGAAIFSASSANNIELMKLLLENGADPSAEFDSSGNCLSIAEGGPRADEAIALLKKYKARPGEWTFDTSEKVIAFLDDHSLEPDQGMLSNILGKILGHDDVDLLERYVDRFGAELIRDLDPAKGWRLPGSQEMVTALLNHGANVNARDWFGRTYLHYLASKDWYGAAESLVSAGIDIDAVDHESGTTALGFAAKSGNQKMVEYLLSAGANAQLPNHQWAQPMTLARKEGHAEIVELLLKHTSG